MDGMRFRSLCANVDRLSVGQLRELRRKLRALDARREVLARIDARGQPRRDWLCSWAIKIPAGIAGWSTHSASATSAKRPARTSVGKAHHACGSET